MVTNRVKEKSRLALNQSRWCGIRWFAHGRCRDHSLLHGVAAIWWEICGHESHGKSVLRCPVDTAPFNNHPHGVAAIWREHTSLDPPEDRAKDDSSHRHGAEVLAVDGDNHSLLHGAEVMVEDRVKDDLSSRRGAEVSVEGRGKDGLSHLDFRVDRVRVVEVDGHRDQCRDARTRSHRCLGITDKRITRRGVLAAMGFLRGWGMS